MERTEALDIHWQGFWYCNTCKFYTGQLAQHELHLVSVLPRVIVLHPTEFQAVRIVVKGELRTLSEYGRSQKGK